ncbi:helix-turn-helix domain-containing protein [Saccharibacter floricola]|uniref:Helix-turn-helix domain-containing protein n=1 Tax=Saccharibacter floricola DSM 15669 TaxID=1123227 RepID=A0ABQ0NZP8_9PROT|nr:helix-turn-helix domain-containing protein [Saccharibacter floricola]GBQ07339.1 hypothetical protein AA15669_1334 [Saccharibacter floricola DSM 15669]
MSIQAINWALEQPGSPTQKHVLLVLANYANESGESFPSTDTLCAATGLSNRCVRQARYDLIEAGLIEKSTTYTRNGVRLVMAGDAVNVAALSSKVAPDARKEAAPATSEKVAPAASYVAAPASKVAADAAPHNHHLTTNNHHTPYSPPKASKPRPKPKQEFALPDWVPVEAWNGWLEMRRSMKKPATVRAMEIAVKRLAAFKAQGHDPSDILETSTLNNWQGLFAPKSQRPHGQQAAPRMSESERNRNIIFEEMRAQYRSQDHANSERIIFQ